MNHHELLGTTSIEQVILKLHNRCNLNCEHCTNKCHLPIDKGSKYSCRRETRVITLEEVERYCILLNGHLDDNIHLISGGEPTFYVDSKFIESIIDMLMLYGKGRIGIRTNGYNLLGLKDKYLKLFDLIYLDDHVVNKEIIDEAYIKLKKIRGNKQTVVERVHEHYNIRELMDNPISRGKRCYMWKRVLLLEYDILWPCCGLPNIVNELEIPQIRDHMIEYGWSTYNDNLIKTLRKGRLPKSVSRLCKYRCWFPAAWTKQPTVPITAKKGTLIAPNLHYNPDEEQE